MCMREGKYSEEEKESCHNAWENNKHSQFQAS